MRLLRNRYLWVVGVAMVVIAMLAFVLGISTAVADPDCGFPDVPSGSWYESAVCWLRYHGITLGYPDGTYKPDNNVTRAEMAAYIHRLAGKNGLFDTKWTQTGSVTGIGSASQTILTMPITLPDMCPGTTDQWRVLVMGGGYVSSLGPSMANTNIYVDGTVNIYTNRVASLECPVGLGNTLVPVHTQLVDFTSEGSHTYQLRANRIAGTATFNMNYPSLIVQPLSWSCP